MRFVAGFIVGIIILPLCAFLYLWLGYLPVATAGAPLPLEKRITSMALHAKISREAPAQPAITPSDENLAGGAKVYEEHCAVCHGKEGGKAETAIAKGMYPHPPQLLKGKGVTDDPPGETYWKAANGIRLTGMPAFRDSLSSTQLWQVSLMLANANRLPEAVKNQLLPSNTSTNRP
jgi:mono/diheme cytochrome c family protein